MTTPRPEYPRPQFERAQWLNLNGEWQFDFDDANAGVAGKWYESHDFSQKITVPFAYQAPLSGIGTNDIHDIVWYRRTFSAPAGWNGKRIRLNFEAVDYRAWVWVNGIPVAFHEGGHVPFSVDVTDFLQAGQNTLVVRAEDFTWDKGQPRGKQFWERKSARIFYTRTTGIWQTVWLEPVSKLHIGRVKMTPFVDSSTLEVEYEVDEVGSDYQIDATVSFGGKTLTTETFTFDSSIPDDSWSGNQRLGKHTIAIPGDLNLWSPETPNLYDIRFKLTSGGAVLDEVQSYFGMRSVKLENGKVLLNGQPYYLKMVLDQSYNPEGILTFPDDAYIKRDIELTKAMGFNGARKHQKPEEPRALYWADKMGLIIWGEMANCYIYTETAIQRIASEFQAAVRRDYNHPCIIAWTPMNESWGVPNMKNDPRPVAHLNSMYALTKSIDPYRPVISNDGWEHAKTDLVTIHDYEGKGEVLTERYSTLEKSLAYLPINLPINLAGYPYEGQPVLLTEFGGIGYKKDAQEGWGYTTASGDEDYIERYKAVIDATYSSPIIVGYCYTQLTDVEQEINGLLTYDRQPKVPLEIIKQINDANNG
ncbi:MAG: glycoside hydrolase family 2 [Chloroflexi bacterium]|nr:glycoside hydrolase family 2 [Chloroflexota bacterium]MCC6897223.1 glycoside hydrolase family 2 [Anaerolineae bacterium]